MFKFFKKLTTPLFFLALAGGFVAAADKYDTNSTRGNELKLVFQEARQWQIASDAPLIEAGDVTSSGSNTTTTAPAIAYPAYASGDLIIMFMMIDDDDVITPAAAGPNGETRTIIGSGDSGNAAGPAIAAMWFVGNATMSAGTQAWAISAAEEWVGKTIKVLASEFDSANPIDSVSAISGYGSADSANVPTPSWATTTPDGRVVVGCAIDDDAFSSAAAGWTNVSSTDIGAVSGTITTRDAATSASETIASVNHQTTADTSSTLGCVVNNPVITISGNVYTNEGSTAYDCSADNLTIGVSVNGGTTTTGTCTLATGAFSITASAPSAAGDPVVVFIDSAETPKGTTVTLAADTTSDISVPIYQNRVIVTSQSATAMTNAKISTGDNGNAGIRYNVASGALTLESGMELHVFEGKTFTPGGSVTTQGEGGLHLDYNTVTGGAANFEANAVAISGDVTIDANTTLTAPSATLTITGNYSNSGTFTHNSGTVTFNKSSGTQTLNSGGTGAGKMFNNVIHSGAGTLQLLTNDLDVNGTFSQTFGIFDANSLNQNFAGNFSLSNSTTYTKGGIITFDGTTSYTDSNSVTKQNIGAIVINGTSVALSSSMTGDTLTVKAGTLSGTNDLIIVSGAITCDVTCGSINLTGGTTTLSGTGNFGSTALASNWTFYNLTFGDGTTDATTSQGTGTITISSVLNIAALQTLNAGGKTWELTGCGTPFVVSGTGVFNYDTSTFKYTSSCVTYITETDYYDLKLGPGL